MPSPRAIPAGNAGPPPAPWMKRLYTSITVTVASELISALIVLIAAAKIAAISSPTSPTGM